MPKCKWGIIGRGQWGTRIAKILDDSSFEVKVLDISRRGAEEDKGDYQERVTDLLKRQAQNLGAIWLAVPPGDQELLVRSALGLGNNVVVEKPWMVSREETEELIVLSRSRGLQVGLHHQYPFLKSLMNLNNMISPTDQGAIFSGQFTTSKRNRFSIPALYILGSHLLAIKCLLFPGAKIGTINVAYKHVKERWISIESQSHKFVVDLLNNSEPIIQRFIVSFEEHIGLDREFPINLRLGLQVNEELKKLKSVEDLSNLFSCDTA